MKNSKVLDIAGKIITLLAFIGIAAGAVFSLNWAFYTGIGLFVAGLVLTVILPAVRAGKWNKVMSDHGVPATARLINYTKPAGSPNTLRLEFSVTDSDITTFAIVPDNIKDVYILDSVWNIKYDPDNTELCLVLDMVKKDVQDEVSSATAQPEDNGGVTQTERNAAAQTEERSAVTQPEENNATDN